MQSLPVKRLACNIDNDVLKNCRFAEYVLFASNSQFNLHQNKISFWAVTLRKQRYLVPIVRLLAGKLWNQNWEFFDCVLLLIFTEMFFISSGNFVLCSLERRKRRLSNQTGHTILQRSTQHQNNSTPKKKNCLSKRNNFEI